MFNRLDAIETEFVELESQLPAIYAKGDPNAVRDAGKRHAEIGPVVDAHRRHKAAAADLAAARELLADIEPDDHETREFLGEEVASREAAMVEIIEELRTLLVPKDPNDGRNVIVEIRGGEGGDEGNIWAGDLYEMYQRFADLHRWKFEILTSQVSEMGGYRDITFLVKGKDAWRHLKHEAGPHRVQRVPATESQGRIHTSAATVAVLPEAEEVDVSIDPNDLIIDVYRATGPGGQSVNTTDSAVRMTHKPTGLVVTCQDEKSQLQNKDKALRIMRSRLLAAEQERQEAELSIARRSQVKGGGRSEKIRTYNYKENRVTDHRIGLTLHKLDQVLQGNLDDLVGPLIAAEQAARLAGEEQ